MEKLPVKLVPFLWHFIKDQKYKFLLIMVFAFAWSLDNTVWPYCFKLLIDGFTNFEGDKANIWSYIWPIMLLWIFLWVLIEVGFRAMGFTMAKAFPKFEASLRSRVFSYVQGHSYEFFANHFAGNISNKISDLVNGSTRILQLTLTLFIPAFIALLIAMIMFATIHMLFALLLLVWVSMHIGVCFLSAKTCSNLAYEHSQSRSNLTGKIVDNFTNIINVKLFSRQKYELDNILKYQEDEKQKNYKTLIYIEKVKIILGLMSLLLPGVLMTWFVIYNWQKDLISIGDVVLIFNATWNIMMLTWISGHELPNFFKEVGTCNQALSIVKAEHDIVDNYDAKDIIIDKGKIEYKDVSFFYEDNKIFDNKNITIESGSKIGLVGFSGSGKTTFVNLIMRFFDLDSGSILIDNQNIKNITVSSLRSNISMIPQEPSLFHRSLRENIRYGRINATDEEVLEASIKAHCHEFIEKMPNGYDTLVGERGIKLSGGQRQRIAIARAILKNAPILILDEATSALDSVTEELIQDSLSKLMADKTTIIIAHRLSTLSYMDRILVFDKGNIIEDGNHETLLNNNGHYAKLWNMQVGGFLPKS